jgi:hypothetical protein
MANEPVEQPEQPEQTELSEALADEPDIGLSMVSHTPADWEESKEPDIEYIYITIADKLKDKR